MTFWDWAAVIIWLTGAALSFGRAREYRRKSRQLDELLMMYVEAVAIARRLNGEQQPTDDT